ncbi:hypothetical protein THASP1DRAFT_18042 [Thamnocephalis sphaerospora]|uniref:SGNH hydrolase-type esterase domain-containing protein n=1 Tax=Thamnocephalis sphaerospora TaxID=78915 RepID=A0A4V1IW93_9FUNG|nr:hypothetical protein THASP1DRAFT_18042 [Thamnocephalis sphaerospora]|eukprot:RKP06759.1 hypothetical protein THASP1DRAFT_18042 [Thamnocephalis sphaerospora]
MKLFSCFLVIAGLACSQAVLVNANLNASHIGECPQLPKRLDEPKHIGDLRVDDIRVFMALGDRQVLLFSARRSSAADMPCPQHHGRIFRQGQDPGAVTLPNAFLHYRKDQIGASVGKRLANICYGPLCPVTIHSPSIDRLNAAQSGAMAQNLRREFEYLVDQLRANKNINYEKDWKFLNLQIGSNDLCLACTALGSGDGMLSPDDYEMHIRTVLQLVRINIPRVYVNLMGNFKVSEVYQVYWSDECLPCCSRVLHRIPGVNLECACAMQGGSVGETLRARMDQRMREYNERLRRIYSDYRSVADPQFAIGLQVFDTNLLSFPDGALSNFDCFHPSEMTHGYIAKTIWNGLTLSQAERPTSISYDSKLRVRCPTANDRLRID